MKTTSNLESFVNHPYCHCGEPLAPGVAKGASEAISQDVDNSRDYHGALCLAMIQSTVLQRYSLLKCMTVVFLVLSLILWVYPGHCDDKTTSYSYNPAGKPDPFKPFIDTIKAKKGASKSPLQMISIEDLQLVGIVWSGKKRIAMVEDSKGKRHHYVLYKGTPIGINEGRVVNILADQVIIEERVEPPSGEVKTKRVVLKLRTEENEEKP